MDENILIENAIKQLNNQIEKWELDAFDWTYKCSAEIPAVKRLKKQAAEYKQIVEWLKDYMKLKSKDTVLRQDVADMIEEWYEDEEVPPLKADLLYGIKNLSSVNDCD